jgi:hypothetical protein
MKPVERVLERAENVRKVGSGWLVSCPCPDHGRGRGDKNPSVSVSEGEDGQVLVNCHTGCETEAVVSEWGFGMDDLFEDRDERDGGKKVFGHTPRDDTATLQRCTLEGYAEAKRLSVEFLKKLGLRDAKHQGKQAVRIPYHATDGSEIAVRFRLALEKSSEGDDRFRWRSGSKTNLYGLERLGEVRKAGYVVLVEGESDAQTLWYHGIPAFGIPGVDTWKPRWADHLEGVEKVYVVVEPDGGGETLKKKLSATPALLERLRPVRLGEHKDASALQVADPERFEERFGAALEEAGGVEGDGPKPAEAPSGAELLVNLIAFIRRYVALSEAQVLLSALWIVHTHALDAAETTPYLNIWSAEKRSGKTRLLETLDLLVARAWFTGRVTSAVLVRKVAAETPTLLLDESDAAFNGDREYAEMLRGVLNAGFRLGGMVSLCIGQGANLTYDDFPAFSPKAIAGIGTLPDTVADRSIPIELRRRRQSERVERFRRRKVGPKALPLQKAAAAWAQENLKALAEAEPELPEELDDRAQDIIEPLLAIAEEVGGEWPVRARDAAVALLTGEHREEAESLGVRLLGDCRTAFNESGEDRLATGKLLVQLRTPEDAPWRALKGEPLDATRLARMLKPYGIKPKKLREGEGTFRGYCRAWFEDAWARYLPADPEDPEHGEQAEHPADRAGSDVPGNPGVPGSENNLEHDSPHEQDDVPGVPGVPGNRAS